MVAKPSPPVRLSVLSFLPWVREGAAAAIAAPDSLTAGPPAFATITAALSINGSPAVSKPVRLRGPADVVGIDLHQILRTDPRPGTSDFEPNFFPLVEFDRADFPWLFTPASAGTNSKLRPWLCLIVVRKQEGVTLTSASGSPLLALQIASPAIPLNELPNLRDSWAWAHAQAAAGASPAAVADALDGAPELSLSRLLCPRILVADTEYIACIVPTFELGRRAGLGLPIADNDLNASTALAPAWSLVPTPPTQLVLPVYHHWEFRTGAGGDFESLARQLTARPAPAQLGRKIIDISHPGFPVPAGATTALESALVPIRSSAPPPAWEDSVAQAFQTGLAPIINEPSRTQAVDPAADPLLAPPIYGRWHAGRATVTRTAGVWLDELNLDPRWRVAAAYGTRIVQEHQEALMASAWEQAGELADANQRMRQLQLSLVVSESVHTRHIRRLDEEMTLRVAAPAFTRIRIEEVSEPDGCTLLTKMKGSAVPIPATRAAMRRIGRQRGPLTRRISSQGYSRSAAMTWVATLNLGDSFPAPGAPPPASTFARVPALPTVADVSGSSWNLGFKVVPEAQPVPTSGDLLPALWDYPGLFRAAAVEHLARVRPLLAPRSRPHLTILDGTKTIVEDKTLPRLAFSALARAVVSTGPQVLHATALGVTPVGVETVMAAPQFRHPMSEPLRELSQDLFLPGLDSVKPDTVLGLRTNRKFIAAYMVGLNFEMGRELLWRGYPTDQRGSYFKSFWGQGVPNTGADDIADLVTWGDRPLGDSALSLQRDEFVLLIRSNLLRRYPNAIVYLTPAVKSTTTPVGAPDVYVPSDDPVQAKLPLFSGAMNPDVCFFGFSVTSDAATGRDGQHGYYVVIQEHPTEPRFGLDVGALPGNPSHLAIGTTAPATVPLNDCIWGRNAAHMAGITRRSPVQIAIHAARLLSAV